MIRIKKDRYFYHDPTGKIYHKIRDELKKISFSYKDESNSERDAAYFVSHEVGIEGKLRRFKLTPFSEEDDLEFDIVSIAEKSKHFSDFIEKFNFKIIESFESYPELNRNSSNKT